jgi:hypothetical protein
MSARGPLANGFPLGGFPQLGKGRTAQIEAAGSILGGRDESGAAGAS